MSSFNWDRAEDPNNQITCWDISLSDKEFEMYQSKGFIKKSGDLYIFDHPDYPQSIIHVYRNFL